MDESEEEKIFEKNSKFLKDTLKEIFTWKKTVSEFNDLIDDYKRIKDEKNLEEVYVYSCKIFNYLKNVKIEFETVYDNFINEHSKFINEIESFKWPENIVNKSIGTKESTIKNQTEKSLKNVNSDKSKKTSNQELKNDTTLEELHSKTEAPDNRIKNSKPKQSKTHKKTSSSESENSDNSDLDKSKTRKSKTIKKQTCNQKKTLSSRFTDKNISSDDSDSDSSTKIKNSNLSKNNKEVNSESEDSDRSKVNNLKSKRIKKPIIDSNSESENSNKSDSEKSKTKETKKINKNQKKTSTSAFQNENISGDDSESKEPREDVNSTKIIDSDLSKNNEKPLDLEASDKSKVINPKPKQTKIPSSESENSDLDKSKTQKSKTTKKRTCNQKKTSPSTLPDKNIPSDDSDTEDLQKEEISTRTKSPELSKKKEKPLEAIHSESEESDDSKVNSPKQKSTKKSLTTPSSESENSEKSKTASADKNISSENSDIETPQKDKNSTKAKKNDLSKYNKKTSKEIESESELSIEPPGCKPEKSANKYNSEPDPEKALEEVHSDTEVGDDNKVNDLKSKGTKKHTNTSESENCNNLDSDKSKTQESETNKKQTSNRKKNSTSSLDDKNIGNENSDTENLQKDKNSTENQNIDKIVDNVENDGKENASNNKIQNLSDLGDVSVANILEPIDNPPEEIDDSVVSEQINESDRTNENEKPETTQKPFVLKLVDINKLLDPKIKEEAVKLETEKKENIVNTSVITLSSDSESEKVPTKKKSPTKSKKSSPNKKDKDKSTLTLSSDSEPITNKNSSKTEEKRLKKNKTSSSSNSLAEVSLDEAVITRTRLRKPKELSPQKLKNKFENLRKLRTERFKKKKYIEPSESSGSSSESENDITSNSKKEKRKRQTKTSSSDSDTKLSKTSVKLPKTKLDLSDYDWQKDIKFTSKCIVYLERYTNEELVQNYKDSLEDKEIGRLTDMKTLERTRSSKRTRKNSTDSSSTNDSVAKTKSKKSKTAKKNKDIDKNSESEESNKISDDDSDSKEIAELEPPIEKTNNIEESIDLFPSDEEVNKSDSDKEEKDENKSTEKKTKKSKGTTKSDENSEGEAKENGADKENGDDKKNGNGKDKDSESDEEIVSKKKNWKNDKLLKGSLNESDSEEEAIRFKNKRKVKVDSDDSDYKNENSDEDNENKESEKKKSTRKSARKLGSGSDDSDGEKSSGDLFQDKKSNSDSEEQETKKKRRRIKKINDSDDSSDEEKKKKKEETRKKIRNVWSKDKLADSTLAAAKEEEKRKKRIAERQKLYNHMYDPNPEHNAKVDKVVLDINDETEEELLAVDPKIVEKLKPHQAAGIQFMWTACFESIARTKKTDGSGCILAHCMGLGKTLQVISLIHTLITSFDQTGVRTVLVVCPLSTVLNWVNEFKKWLDDLDGEQINVFELVTVKNPRERLYQAKDWQKFGGVLVIGYDMFRNLTNPKGKRQSKKITAGFNQYMVDPGPELVVCDEGHLLKNEKTGISIAMNKLRTKRRIVLTGTPLQNNLKEYYCMVQFVKPDLLGTYKEYMNRFVNPITNGQYTDSTERDIAIMRRRSHVLHKMLDGIVQRRDYSVLAPFLPPKHEYILFITLTKIQIDLYKEYLDKFSRNKSEGKGMSFLFQDFQELQRICIHPRVLLDKSIQDKIKKDKEEDDSEGSLKDFIDDDDLSEKSTSSNDSSSEDESKSSEASVKVTRRTRANPGGVESEPEVEEPANSDEWWSKFITGDELDNINHSSKILLLFEILHQCEMIGDKVLVFSQSLYSLNLIEYFLGKIDEATQNNEKSELLGGYQGSWTPGLDYFRLDGSTSCDKRSTWCKLFNSESNPRARLFLISTRAGGLGINLVAANRVIIFDVSWNPSHDIQSIYRVYRFGQTKPCYIYRFVTFGTMENKIYERQVTKQAISKRVIDEQQIDRHYNQNDLAELYAFNAEPTEDRPVPMVPKDRLFADLLQSHEKNIYKYHEHNSLLENKEEETLNEEERKAAWEEFENEKKAPQFNLMTSMANNGMYDALISLIKKDNPTANYTPIQLSQLAPSLINMINTQISQGDFRMYRRILEEKQRIQEQRSLELQYAKYIQQLSQGHSNPLMLQQFFKSNPLQQFANIPGPPPNMINNTASGSQLLNPFAKNDPKISNEVVEIHDD